MSIWHTKRNKIKKGSNLAQGTSTDSANVGQVKSTKKTIINALKKKCQYSDNQVERMHPCLVIGVFLENLKSHQ